MLQMVLSSLQIEAGLVGQDSSSLLLSGAQVWLNTFFFVAVQALSLPLLPLSLFSKRVCPKLP